MLPATLAVDCSVHKPFSLTCAVAPTAGCPGSPVGSTLAVNVYWKKCRMTRRAPGHCSRIQVLKLMGTTLISANSIAPFNALRQGLGRSMCFTVADRRARARMERLIEPCVLRFLALLGSSSPTESLQPTAAHNFQLGVVHLEQPVNSKVTRCCEVRAAGTFSYSCCCCLRQPLRCRSCEEARRVWEAGGSAAAPVCMHDCASCTDIARMQTYKSSLYPR